MVIMIRSTRLGHRLLGALGLLALSLTSPDGFAARTTERGWTEQVTLVRAYDGDSAIVRSRTRDEFKIRVAGIDAPEKGQRFAKEARVRFEEFMRSGSVEAHGIKKDGFGRWIVTLRVRDTDLGQLMIREGYAWYFRRYRADLSVGMRQTYEEAEAVAREERRGLWVEDDPIAPWRFRHRAFNDADEAPRNKPRRTQPTHSDSLLPPS
ncbi:MAG: thermonuclease family protein [Betaproteobacteria bacterium]|nr:thermonuclease family protein [Betaproteobacteria bacterium]NBT74573.1 thermonuclease family protein [Betaproteobacteria bacterium]